jgi:hypothetical protein
MMAVFGLSFGTALALATLAGCAARRPVVEIGGYYFDYEGKTYRIESVNPASKVGYNILALREEDQDRVVGLDYDQDGMLDGVVEGMISLDRAIRIYSAGIAEGERRGVVRSRFQTHEYRVVINDYTYVLVTYKLALGDVFNRLTILTAYYAPEEAILLDLGADGKLDTIENGDGDLEYYQALYDQVIDQGLKYGRVERIDGMYQVVPLQQGRS